MCLHRLVAQSHLEIFALYILLNEAYITNEVMALKGVHDIMLNLLNRSSVSTETV